MSTQAPETQELNALTVLQASPQPPQLAVLVLVLVSQPLARLLSQFP